MGKVLTYVDENGVEHNLNFTESEIKDSVTGGQSTWSSSKIVSDTTSRINNALTNLSKVKIIQISDCNNAYPDENGKKETYFADGTAINTPSNSLLWFIESERFFYSNNWRITQVAISQSASATNKPQQYIRHGTYVPSSSTWTWGEWEKVTTETDVNNALAKYQSFFDTYTTDTKKRLKITISNEHFYVSLLGDSNLRGLIDTTIGININASGSVEIANKGNISLTASLNRTTKELIVTGFTEWNNLRISGKNISNIEIIE